MSLKLTYPLVILLLMLLIPAMVFATSGEGGGNDNVATDSVRITINGQPVEGPVKQGQVIHQEDADRAVNECVFPSISIKMRGDVKKVRVGPRENTCDFEIKALEMNDTPIPSEPPADSRGFPDRTLGNSFLNAAGWKWRVESLAKVVGLNSYR